MFEKIKRIKRAIDFFKYQFYYPTSKKKYGYYGKNVEIQLPIIVTNPEHVFLYDNTNICGYANLIISYKNGNFIMKKNSGAAQGLTVVTANHQTYPPIGIWHKEIYRDINTDVMGGDVVVEEDVWLATHVTLLPGVTIGRGSIIGAGAVCRKSIPPYAIALGNPAKVVGFKYSPEEIIEHEKKLYPEHERIPLEVLERNYKKYYSKRIKDIANYLK